jgi:hypothetical protein
MSINSISTVLRHISWVNLIQPLMKIVDNRRIAFNPTVELSYLVGNYCLCITDLESQRYMESRLNKSCAICARVVPSTGLSSPSLPETIPQEARASTAAWQMRCSEKVKRLSDSSQKTKRTVADHNGSRPLLVPETKK